MTTDAPVTARSEAGVAWLTLNRPEKRNALNQATLIELLRLLSKAEDNADIRAVAIRGAGDDFCAGADLAELRTSQKQDVATGLAEAQRLGEVFIKIRRCPKPVIAVVTGRALGGGCGLATACDLILAHEDARFAYPELHLGFVPALVMTPLRRKVGESVAFELVARGRQTDAATAKSLGLVNQVMAGASFDEDVKDYLEDMARRPPTAMALAKQLLCSLDGLGYEDAIARGSEVNALARLTRECREGVSRFLKAKRKKE